MRNSINHSVVAISAVSRRGQLVAASVRRAPPKNPDRFLAKNRQNEVAQQYGVQLLRDSQMRLFMKMFVSAVRSTENEDGQRKTV